MVKLESSKKFVELTWNDTMRKNFKVQFAERSAGKILGTGEDDGTAVITVISTDK